MNSLIKKFWPYLLCVALFALIASVYMSPTLKGEVLITHDNLSWRGSYHEVEQYHEETGNASWWTGSMFSGMPNYQIGGGLCSSRLLSHPINWLTHYGSNNSNAIIMVFFYALGFFALLLAFGINKWQAAVGAIAISFSSYFFIIIGAGHNSKVATLALFAFVVAGFYLIYHGRKILGSCLTMFFVSVGFAPHPQMAYYYCFIIGAFFLAEVWEHYKSGEWKKFGVCTALFFGSFLLGLGTTTATTFANVEYMAETMRGGHSELTKNQNEADRTEGLDLSYATAWSYGIDETLTLLIPDFMGGASSYALDENSDLYKTMKDNHVDKENCKSFCKGAPTYWGTQSFTSGPVYVGAIICFLFVLGLLIVKGAYKWALLAVTVLSILLSWGHNFMPLTKFFFSVVPMYNKFRAVSSILIIAEVTMPLLGFLALKRITDKSVDKESLKRSIAISAGVTGAICLFFALFGGMLFDFTSPVDKQLYDWMQSALVEQRASMLSSDAWRSFLFVALAALLVWIYAVMDKLKVPYLAAILGVLILADMWPVNKRYMNETAFDSEKKLTAYFKKKPYEKELLKDKSHFRVLNLAANTFNESRTSYYLKSIGGYSAAKLRRYQDLIEEHISPEFSPLYGAISSTGGRLELCQGDSLFPVLNMLNAKYFIVPTQSNGDVAVPNPHAMGNAWFVSDVKCVPNADEECDALATENLHEVAVVDARFESFVKDKQFAKDSSSAIELTKYTPEYIEYKSSSKQDGLALFSEIYYPYGWKAYVDGEYKEHFRADYILRALEIPAGEHEIRFVFDPDSISKGNIISVICLLLMYGCILAAIVWGVMAWRKDDSKKTTDLTIL